MVRRVKKYPVIKLHGTSIIKVPEGSAIIGADAFENTNEIVNLLILEDVLPSEEKPETEELEILAITGEGPFSDPGDDKALQYIDTVVWDRGYKITHIFQIEDLPSMTDDLVGLFYPPEMEDVEIDFDTDDSPETTKEEEEGIDKD